MYTRYCEYKHCMSIFETDGRDTYCSAQCFNNDKIAYIKRLHRIEKRATRSERLISKRDMARNIDMIKARRNGRRKKKRRNGKQLRFVFG